MKKTQSVPIKSITVSVNNGNDTFCTVDIEIDDLTWMGDGFLYKSQDGNLFIPIEGCVEYIKKVKIGN